MLKTLLLFAARFKKLHFAGSRLQYFWTFLNPLLLGLVVSFVFENIFKVSNRESLLDIFSGFLLWQFIAQAVSGSHRILLEDRGYYKQLSKGRSFYLPGFVLFRGLTALPGFLLLAAYCWTRLPFCLLSLPFFVFTLFSLMLFLIGVGYLLSTWTVFCPDISHGLDTLMLFLLWLTPVFYEARMVPDDLKCLCFINPFSWFMDLWRYSLGLEPLFSPWFPALFLALLSLATLLFALTYSKKHHRELLKQL